MKSRRRNISEDHHQSTLQQRLSQLNSDGEYSFPIPMDLIVEIFSRLSTKSIAICRCVSKLWASMLLSSDFTESLFIRSLARPKLLFACENNNKLLIFSTPQPQNPDEKSSPIIAKYHMSFPYHCRIAKFKPTSGFVYIRDEKILEGKKTPEAVCVICNPSTGQSITLPKMKTRKRIRVTSFLGYDPIEKQYKVLAMANCGGADEAEEHQVLTLGTGKLTWRMVQCDITHYRPGPQNVCIDGVLYYDAMVSRYSAAGDDVMIVCFDVRSEKYRFIKVAGRIRLSHGVLVNYNGKLASVRPQYSITSATRSFEMWVLDDPRKHEWSKHVYYVPPMWKDVVADKLHIVGLIGTNEIVLSDYIISDPFFVYYYNFERKTIRRVEIQGMREGYRAVTFLNHVETVKLM